MAIPNVPKLKKAVNPFSVLPAEEEDFSLSKILATKPATTANTTLERYPTIAKSLQFKVGEGLTQPQQTMAKQTLQKEFQTGKEESARGLIPQYEFSLGDSVRIKNQLVDKKIKTGYLSPDEEKLLKESIDKMTERAMGVAMGSTGPVTKVGTRILPNVIKGIVPKTAMTAEVPVFKGFKDLSTKFLEYAKNKTTLSRQEILDFAKRPEIKKGEADLLNVKAKEITSKRVSAQEFADSIHRDLLKLKPMKVKEPQYQLTTIHAQQGTKALRGENYEEVVFESPITTNGSSHYPNSKNYFAHARGDEVVEPVYGARTGKHEVKTIKDKLGNTTYELYTDGKLVETTSRQAEAQGHELANSELKKYNKIWREQEIQSDLLQKDNLNKLIGEVPLSIYKTPKEKLLFDLLEESNTYNDFMVNAVEKGGIKTTEIQEFALNSGVNNMRDLFTKYKSGQLKGTQKINQLQPFTNDRFGERIMRERIKEKASKGYDKYRLPTGETIGKIEGFETREWVTPQGLVVEPRDLKVGMEVIENFPHEIGDSWIITDILGDGRFKAVPKQWELQYKRALEDPKTVSVEHYKEIFDLTGKSNPQYIRYENWGKFLKNKYGGKEVTDSQGNTWYEIDLKPEYKRLPIEAFGALPLMIQNYKKEKENLTVAPPQEQPKLNVTDNTEFSKFTATYYDPKDPNQTRPDNPEGKGAFMTPVVFGDVATGNRSIPKGTFIFIKQLEDVKTPYGMGIFKVNDRMNSRYNKKDKAFFDIAIPTGMPNKKEMEKRIGKQSFDYMFVKPDIKINSMDKKYPTITVSSKQDGKGGPGLSSQYPNISSLLQPASMGTSSVPSVAPARFDSYTNVLSAIKNRGNVFRVLPEEEKEPLRSISPVSSTMTSTTSVIKKNENLVKLVNEAVKAGVDKTLAERLAYGGDIPKLKELIKSYKPTQKRTLASFTKTVLPGLGETGKELLQFPQRAIASVGLDLPAGILSQAQGKYVSPEYQPTGRWQQAVLGKEPIKGAQKSVGELFPKARSILSKVLPEDVATGAALAAAPFIVAGSKALDLLPVGGAEKNIAKQSAKIAALKDWKLIVKELEPVVKGSKDSIEALAKGLVDMVNPKEIEETIRVASGKVASAITEKFMDDFFFTKTGLSGAKQESIPIINRDFYHGISGSRLKKFKKTGEIPKAQQAFGGDFSITDDFDIAKGHAGNSGKVIKIKLKNNTSVTSADPFADDFKNVFDDILEIGESEFIVNDPSKLLIGGKTIKEQGIAGAVEADLPLNLVAKGKPTTRKFPTDFYNQVKGIKESPSTKFPKVVEAVKGEVSKAKETAQKSIKNARDDMNLRYHNLTEAEKKDLNATLKTAKEEGKFSLERDMPRKDEEILQAAEYADILKGTMSREKAIEMEGALVRTKQHADALYKKIKSGEVQGEELKQLEREMFESFKVIRDTMTFQGRALQANKAYITPELYDLRTQLINRLRKMNFDIDEILKEAEGVNWDNIDDVSRFWHKFIKPNFLDVVDEYRYINLLSSPKTHIINALTNLLQATVVSPVTRLATGAIDGIASTLTGRERQAYAREVIPYAKGLFNSIGDATSSALRVLKGAMPVERPDLPNLQVPFDFEKKAKVPILPTLLQNIKGKTGTVVRAPIKAVQTIPRALEAGDIFFRTLIKRGEMESLAYRYQRQGIEITPEIAQKIEQEAEDKAAYYIFRKALDPKNETGQGYFLSGIDHITNLLYNIRRNFTFTIPGTKKVITIPNPIGWFIPFVQTPMNILKQGIEYSPVGVLNIPGARNKEEQIAKALIGSAVTASAAWAGVNGNLTWEVPKDPKEKQAFYDSGRKPYSIRIGGKWISFSKLGPIAYPLALAAATNWYWRENPKASSESYEKRLSQIFQGMAGFFSDQSYVQGIGNVIDALQGDEYSIQQIVTNIPTQLIPLVSLQRWVAQILDPVYRKPESEFSYQSVIENIQAGLPMLSKEIPPYETMTGEPSKRLPINIVSPFDVGNVNPEAEKLLQTIRQIQEMKTKSSKVKEDFDTKAKEAYDKVISGELSFPTIIKTDPELAKAVSDLGKEKSYEVAEGESINTLGVKNWDRAKFIYRKYKELKTPEERSALIQSYIKRKILTKEVNKQFQVLLKEGVNP